MAAYTRGSRSGAIGTGGAYSNVGGSGVFMGPSAPLEAARFRAKQSSQDRAHEINMREMQYIAAQQALGLGGGQAGAGGAGGMNQWLDQWNQTLKESKGVYNKALESFEGAYEWMTDAKESANRLGGLADEMEGEYRSYRKDFAGTEEAFRLASQEELQARGVARGQLMEATKADYEGVSGRAMADVSAQGNLARQAEARRMQRLGVDPSTMRGQAGMQRIAGQEATGKAIASTQARRGEKERATGATTMAMQLLDPSRMAQTAIGIRGAGTEMLGMASQLRGQETSALSGLAGQQANIATGQANIAGAMAQNIGGQYGDMGGLQMGLQYQGQQNAQNMFTQFAGMNPSGGGATSPFQQGQQ